MKVQILMIFHFKKKNMKELKLDMKKNIKGKISKCEKLENLDIDYI